MSACCGAFLAPDSQPSGRCIFLLINAFCAFPNYEIVFRVGFSWVSFQVCLVNSCLAVYLALGLSCYITMPAMKN